jgi:hypothetical protein
MKNYRTENIILEKFGMFLKKFRDQNKNKIKPSTFLKKCMAM